MGAALRGFSHQESPISFLVSSPRVNDENTGLILTLPVSIERDYSAAIKKSVPNAVILQDSPVALFSMHGPHFGDRYGIAFELLKALSRTRVHLFALGCSISSIVGVLPAEQMERATEAIRACFEVPSVIKKC
jgi:aspartokinase